MALVLTLEDGDFLFIGPDVTLAICHFKGKKFRVAIEAPRTIKIDRSTGKTKLKKELQK